MSDKTRRLHYLDSLRGIAAMAVVAAHYVFDVALDGPTSGPAGAGADGIAQFDAVVDIGKFGVVLFFLVSGYIIPNSIGSGSDRISRFCVSRFFRLYPLYWATLIFGILLPYPTSLHGFDLATILANITMVQGYLGHRDIIGAAWTLQIELTFYGACLLLASRSRMATPRACAAASAACLGFAFMLAIARNMLVIKLPVALPLALSVMFFGTVWRQATLSKLPDARRLVGWLLGAIVVAIIPISLIGYNHDFGFHEKWLPYATSYLLAISVFTLCTTRFLITWRPIVWLGEISYSLYLVHPLVPAAAFYAGLVAVAMPVAPVAACLPMLAAVILISWGANVAIEKPFVAFGHRFRPASRQAKRPSQESGVARPV